MTQNQTTSNSSPLHRPSHPHRLLTETLALLALLTTLACGGRPPPLPPVASPQPPVSTAPVEIPEPPTVAPPGLEAQIEPELIQEGESALLTWKATNADRVVIDHNIGSVETSGRIRFFPEGSTSYEVTAEGDGGTVIRNVTVEVLMDETISEEDLAGRTLKEQFESSVQPVFFEYDSTELTSEARVALDESIGWLTRLENGPVRFLLEGHCDQRGTEEYNLALGDKRAQTVRAYLLEGGVDGSRMRTLSLGEERPFDSRQTEQAWTLNRRVHFVLTDED